MNILVCTPYRPSTHPALVERWWSNAHRLASQLASRGIWLLSLAIADTNEPQPRETGFAAHARARNSLLDAIDLSAYDYLYWVDIDILRWADGLIDWALKHNPDGVTAPAVVLDRYIDRFYDTWGFLERKQPARLYPPWFEQSGSIITLDSVGCCYLIPAIVYRDGARYQDLSGATEHLSVCLAARRQHRAVLANLDFRATHAYLPEYGEDVH